MYTGIPATKEAEKAYYLFRSMELNLRVMLEPSEKTANQIQNAFLVTVIQHLQRRLYAGFLLRCECQKRRQAATDKKKERQGC